MPKKITIENLAEKIDSGFESADKNFKLVRDDLITHDERTDTIIELIQDLGHWQRVDEKVERIREFLRKQHKVEV